MALPWDHNRWYHPYVLRRLPPGARKVLDLGCGAGTLAARLAERVPVVDAVDADPAITAVAATRTRSNVAVHTADALDWLAAHPSTYDAVVSVSVLHHLPLAETLTRVRASLRPGGTLVGLTLCRPDLPRDIPVELAATTMHHAIGAALVGRGWLSRDEHPLRAGRHGRHGRAGVPMRVADPTLTATETRRILTEVLPGSSLRRLVLWRYAVEWRRLS